MESSHQMSPPGYFWQSVAQRILPQIPSIAEQIFRVNKYMHILLIRLFSRDFHKFQTYLYFSSFFHLPIFQSKNQVKNIGHFSVSSQCYRKLPYWAPLCITLKIRIWVVAYFFNFFPLFQQKKFFFYKVYFM